MTTHYPKIAQLKTLDEFRGRLDELGLELPVDEQLQAAPESPLARPLDIGRLRAGNRWCIHPMEGWDAEANGSPSELTLRRWRRFGSSGAKLIWGGEAAAVVPDGRANPRQTLATPSNRDGLWQLLEALRREHRERFGRDDDLVVGLQLTHSGRFCRPWDHRLQPRIAYHHPLLDKKFGIAADDDSVVWTDAQLERLIDAFLTSAHVAAHAGFQFVDVKACHGYLLHEFLGAFRRSGPFGGDYDGRTRLLKTIVSRIRDELPELEVVVRLSVFDLPPFEASDEGARPAQFQKLIPYEFGFGINRENPLEMDLSEPMQLIADLRALGVVAVNVTAGSPYYTPHIQRPAIFPPSDGYPPPEDPLAGAVRQVHATGRCKEAAGSMPIVGSGYSYFQDYLPHVAQAVVRQGWADAVGLGRMVLSYPELPADVLAGRPLARKKICRTFSDCTTAPRNHLVSGCYPLDAFYKDSDAAKELKRIKSRRP